jgi:hypothetical protein
MTANDSQVRQAGTSTTAKLADELSEASIASRGFLDRLWGRVFRARPYVCLHAGTSGLVPITLCYSELLVEGYSDEAVTLAPGDRLPDS